MQGREWERARRSERARARATRGRALALYTASELCVSQLSLV